MRITVRKQQSGVSPLWLVVGVALVAVAAWGVSSTLGRKSAPARTSVTVPAEAPAEPSAPPVTEAPSEPVSQQGMGGVG